MLLIGGSEWFDTDVFFALSLGARVFSGIGAACIFTVGYAIPQSDYPEEMNEILGLCEFYSGLGLMVGPVVGSSLFYLAGFKGLFFSLAVLFLLTAPLIYHWLGPDREYKEGSMVEEQPGLLCFRIIVNAMALGYSMAMIGFLDTAIAPHLATYGVNEEMVGVILACTDCAYTLSSYILSKILKYLPLLWVLSFGLLLSSLAFYLMGPWEYLFPQELSLVILGMACLSMGLGVVLVATLPGLVEVAVTHLGIENSDKLSDDLSGLATSFMSLGEVAGPLLGGLLVDLYGFNDGAAIMGGLGMTLLFFFLWVERKRVLN
jgi:predicted MFS family arabinose efflux permease